MTNKSAKYSKIFFILFSIFLSLPLRADENPVAAAPAKGKEAPTLMEQLAQSKEKREQTSYFVFVNYSPFDLLIPSKIGITGGYHQSSDKTWELEYMKGAVAVPFVVKDLGSMTDERFTVMARTYFGGNSFNFSYGLSYFNFSLHLGDKLLSRVTGGNYPSIDFLELKALGGHVGIGNRWALKNGLTFGVDWISWSQPLFTMEKNSAFLTYATNEEDRDDVGKALNVISYFPRFAVIKMQVGYVF